MRTRGRPLAVDTNILLRYILGDHESLSPKAKKIVGAIRDKRIVVVCHPVILAEVVWTLAKRYDVPREKIAENVESIVQLDCFLLPEKDIFLEALRLYATSIPHFGDACACAMATEYCDGKLLSFDRKLSSVAGISRSESV